jgi:hypothetical protein
MLLARNVYVNATDAPAVTNCGDTPGPPDWLIAVTSEMNAVAGADTSCAFAPPAAFDTVNTPVKLPLTCADPGVTTKLELNNAGACTRMLFEFTTAVVCVTPLFTSIPVNAVPTPTVPAAAAEYVYVNTTL